MTPEEKFKQIKQQMAAEAAASRKVTAKSLFPVNKEMRAMNRSSESIDITISKGFKCIINREITDRFDAVKIALEYKYKNLKEYDNTLVILGYNVKCDISNYRKLYPNYKIIIYQLEQLYDNKSFWYDSNSINDWVRIRTQNIQRALVDCDEIWDYDLDNIEFLLKEGFKNIKHVPLFYCPELKRNNKNLYPEYDILFYGSINDRRAEYLSKLALKYKICIISEVKDCNTYKNSVFGEFMITSEFGDKLYEYIFNSKIIINLHFYEGLLQEQVRIFELLINNKLVLSEKSLRNYFGDCILEFNNFNDMIKKIDDILKNEKWKNINVDIKFRNNGKRFKIGAVYNTFYGLELIENSINSIRNIVDYIVIVHQKRGFNGEDEPSVNKYILEYLFQHKLIDEIVYYDTFIKNTRNNILEKRNIGLQYCKSNNCDFIIPLDADENYNEYELLNEINYMYDNNIETLYCPIYSYYYDKFHYFEDTYYVPAVYKINNRKFIKTSTSVIIDPLRKMEEGTYKISDSHMHHYSYLKEFYHYKFSSVMSTNITLIDNITQIQEKLHNWKEGDLAYIHKNDKSGNLYIATTELIKK